MLHFHLAGINNQNFIMRDDETGSWWQQVTGEAILGPLQGKHLKPVFHDELSFGTWKREDPQGRVLKPDEKIVARGKYATADWEQRMERVPVATLLHDESLGKRTLIVGITIKGTAKAYPFTALQKQNPIIDSVGGTPLLIVLGDDGKSVRAFERVVDGRKREFFLKPDSSPLRLVDETGSEWDFTGVAVSGPLAGKTLTKIAVLEDYWFDWKTYNLKTAIYALTDR